jgi:hypothetical protein
MQSWTLKENTSLYLQKKQVEQVGKFVLKLFFQLFERISDENDHVLESVALPPPSLPSWNFLTLMFCSHDKFQCTNIYLQAHKMPQYADYL